MISAITYILSIQMVKPQIKAMTGCPLRRKHSVWCCLLYLTGNQNVCYHTPVVSKCMQFKQSKVKVIMDC